MYIDYWSYLSNKQQINRTKVWNIWKIIQFSSIDDWSDLSNNKSLENCCNYYREKKQVSGANYISNYEPKARSLSRIRSLGFRLLTTRGRLLIILTLTLHRLPRHHGLHFPCSISLITFTPAANYTYYKNQSQTTVQCRVLSAFISLLAIATLRSHSVFPEFSSSQSCFFTRLHCVLILAWLPSSVWISACLDAYSLSWIYLCLVFRTVFAPRLDYFPFVDSRCLACAIPVCWCFDLPVSDHVCE